MAPERDLAVAVKPSGLVAGPTEPAERKEEEDLMRRTSFSIGSHENEKREGADQQLKS